MKKNPASDKRLPSGKIMAAAKLLAAAERQLRRRDKHDFKLPTLRGLRAEGRQLALMLWAELR